MGVKRPREEATGSSGLQRKRQRNRDARTIATQSASAALKQGALPIQDYLNARRFEIRALRDAVRKSREAGVQRAFQSLPRYLRRRAASHNAKRVPRRIRAKARAEIDDADGGASHNKRKPFKRKRGRRETMRKLASMQEKRQEAQAARLEGTDLAAFKDTSGGRFCKRQRNKTWLPSHLWVAKRAHMSTRWGYALPVSPNEKTYRATHRASKSKGVMVFDTSYMGTLLMHGRAKQVATLLECLTHSRECCGQRAQHGAYAVEAQAYAKNFLCPVTVIWDGSWTESSARVQVRIHPTGFAAVWQTLLHHRREQKLPLVKLIDTRFSVGSMELVGPMAVNTLLSVLKSQVRDGHTHLFKSLHGLLPKEVPPNIVLPLLVQDPRRMFPPRLVTEPAKMLNVALEQVPQSTTGSPLFYPDQIETANRARPSQSDFEKHKNELALDTIPLLITRNRLGFCLQAPWATLSDFWYVFNHIPHVRFGGTQEYAQVHYEASVPCFPTDFPGTAAGEAEAKHKRDELEVAHLRRPPAKRPNFDKARAGQPEHGDPYACDWAFLLDSFAQAQKDRRKEILGISQTDVSHVDATVTLSEDEPTASDPMDLSMQQAPSSDRIEDTTMHTVDESSVLQPLATQRMQVDDSFTQPQTAAKPQEVLEEFVAKVTPLLVTAQGLDQMVKEGRSHPRAIVQVKIIMLQRGCPSARACIYASTMADGKRVPGALLGFLTTGNFDLGQGKATGLGCLLLAPVMDAYKTQRKPTAKQSKQARVMRGTKSAQQVQGRCFVRDVGTNNYREASWVMVE